MSYVSFDGLVDRFQGQIYETRKGRLRMRLIDELYRRHLPLDQLSEMNVLDAAGGLGQISHWFLEMNANVEYFDVSKDMVEAVTTSLSTFSEKNQFFAQQASITDFVPKTQYDIVNAHAVLEWLENPLETLDQLVTWVKPGGYLCLMVYNKHMLMLRHLMRGTLKRAMSGNMSGDKKGLTPISPLDPQEVHEILLDKGYEVITQAGIRSFSDLTEKTVLDWYSEDDVFNAELELCERRPYSDMARYVLFIAKRPLD
jgi:S-adenosylmethionine-dependent methyltransferase